MKQAVNWFLCGVVLSLSLGGPWALADQKKVSVIAFHTTDDSALGTQVAEQVHQALGMIAQVQVVGMVVKRQAQEQAQANALGEQYGLNQVVTGSVGQFLNTIVIDMRVIDVPSLSVVKTLNVSGRADETSGMVTQLMHYFHSQKGVKRDHPVVQTPEVVPDAPIDVPERAPEADSVATTTQAQTWGFTVITEPEDAVVRMMNIKPKYTPNMQLSPGAYSVQVTKLGYKRYSKWVRIRAKDIVLNVTLVKKGG